MKVFSLILYCFFILGCKGNAQEDREQEEEFAVVKTQEQWKKELTPDQFKVLRLGGTEEAYSSDLLKIEEAGIFVCAACGNELYRTANKFESGTGWPSFDRPLREEKIIYRPDPEVNAMEVLCANCGGHLGHIFHDGPSNTTGKRHCINGIALEFVPDP